MNSKFRLSLSPSHFLARISLSAAGHAHRKQEKLLVRAANAEVQGDLLSANRYRQRADRERRWAERCERLAAENMQGVRQSPASEVRVRSPRVGVDGGTWVAQEVAEHSGSADWSDLFGGLDG